MYESSVLPFVLGFVKHSQAGKFVLLPVVTRRIRRLRLSFQTVCIALTVIHFFDDWLRLSMLVYSIKAPVSFDRNKLRAGASRWPVANLTIRCTRQRTRCRFVCMLASSHFRTQIASTCTASERDVSQ